MMDRRSSPNNFLHLVNFHERKLVASSIVAMVLLAGMLSAGILVGKIRVPVLNYVESIVDYWDDRWSRRVEYGERLVNSKQYEDAVQYLATLDRIFPAQNVRHKRDMERERILRGLGHSYSELGKKRLTLETYRRLVEFDPRNFESRYLLAQACVRFNEIKLAQEHFAGLLKFHPTHLPSVQSVLKIFFDRGDFVAVVDHYEAYLNAFLLQPLTVELGGAATTFNVPVDGYFHDVDLRLLRDPGTSSELRLQVGELAIEVERVRLKAPLVVGKTGVSTTAIWPGPTSWNSQKMIRVASGRYRGLGPGASLRLGVPPQPEGIAAVYLRLRLFKQIDHSTWSIIRTSYERLLRYDALRAAQSRSIIGFSVGNDQLVKSQ